MRVYIRREGNEYVVYNPTTGEEMGRSAWARIAASQIEVCDRICPASRKTDAKFAAQSITSSTSLVPSRVKAQVRSAGQALC